MKCSRFKPFQEARLQHPHALPFTHFDFVFARSGADALVGGAALDRGLGALHVEVLDHHDRVAVLEDITVRVLGDDRPFVFVDAHELSVAV